MLQGTEIINRNEPNDQFINTIRGLYLTMNFLGVWPRQNSGNRYNSYRYVHSLGLAFLLVGYIAGFILNLGESTKLVECAAMGIPVISICMKWLTFCACKNSIKKLLSTMVEDWSIPKKNSMMCQSVPESKQIMMNYARTARIFFFTYVIMMTFGLTSYVRDWIAVQSSRDNETDIDMLLMVPHTWYPVVCNRSSNIQFLVVCQTITSVTLTLVNLMIDNLFVAVTMHLCSQFNILRCFIEGIAYDSVKPEYCMTKVTLMAARHQELLRVGKSIQDTYGVIILEQLIACTLTISFLGYTIIAEMEKTEASTMVVLKTGFIVVATLLTIFSYCYVGDHLTNHSIAIAMAVYKAPWYTCTRSMNLSFLIVMIRAQRPVEITGGKLLPMSLESFTVLMKAAASYLSALRTIGISET